MKLKSKSKKGSHVGMILSFVIFITFLVFIYSAVQPAIKTNKDKEIILQYLEKELTKQFTSQLISLKVLVNSNMCPYILGSEVDIDNIQNMGVIVKDSSGTKQTSLIYNTNNVYVSLLNSAGKILDVYYSTEFTRTVGSQTCSPATIKLKSEYEYIFESKVKTFSEEDYATMKTLLSVPIGNDFGFVFSDKDRVKLYGTIDVIPTGRNVYSQEIPIQYVDGEANIKSGFLTIKIW